LFVHEMDLAIARALLSAGSSIPARIAMIAITTRSSIKVKLRLRFKDENLLMSCSFLQFPACYIFGLSCSFPFSRPLFLLSSLLSHHSSLFKMLSRLINSDFSITFFRRRPGLFIRSISRETSDSAISSGDPKLIVDSAGTKFLE